MDFVNGMDSFSQRRGKYKILLCKTKQNILLLLLLFEYIFCIMKSSRAEKRNELLAKIGNKLREEEKGDFNIDRWLEGFDENVELCSAAIEEYSKNRRALGLDGDNAFNDFYSRADIQKYCRLFPQSKLDPEWVNDLDNGLVFVEMGPKDAAKTAKLIRTGQFLHCFFGWLEHMLRLILRRESETGRRSFAVCIFDMANVSIWQYANPMGPINRIFEMRVHLAMAYYAEMLSKVVIVNPPHFLAILFKIMSFLLPTKIIGRFHIAQNGIEAAKWICSEAIPIGLGGKKQIGGENGDELMGNGCIQTDREFGKNDFLKDGAIWEKYSVESVNHELVSLKPGRSFVRVLNARVGQILLFELFANRTFEFKVENEAGEYLLPNLRLCTPELAEEGEIRIGKGNEEKGEMLVRVEVKNVGRILGMRLRIGLQLLDNANS